LFILWIKFGKEILLYTPLLKWYLQQGFKITKFHCAIKYTPEKSFQQFADEVQVSDARRAGGIDTAYRRNYDYGMTEPTDEERAENREWRTRNGYGSL
jgi:hypothetical protein